jgi:hypothetical protein
LFINSWVTICFFMYVVVEEEEEEEEEDLRTTYRP